MSLLEQLLGGRNSAAVDQIGRQLGLDPSTTQSALDALLPSVAAGVQRNAATPQGLEALLGALGGGQHQRYVDNPAVLAQPDAVEDGNGILGHIFGSKDVSREVAARAAAQTGIGQDVLKQMLPMVAALVMGALARGGAQGGGVGGLQAGLNPTGSAGGGILDMLTPMLDANRDGSMIDDLIGKFLK
jgi:hypothetical protein